jgi:hypothetical protein
MKRVEWFENIFVTIRVAVVLLCTGLLASSASAQTPPPEPSTKGFSVGGHVAIIGSSPDSIDVNGQRTDIAGVTTPGGGVSVAYGVTDWLTVVLNGDGHETHDDRHLGFADIGAQFFLPGGSGFRPHLDVALTGRRADFETATGTADTRGASLSFGGGVLYFVSRSVALDATLLRSAGDLDQYVDDKRLKDGDAIGVPATRLLIGLRWYPGR